MSNNRVFKNSASANENTLLNNRRKSRIPMKSKLHIIERYKNGDTLTNIARDFNCTPSAISYIVNTVAQKVANQVADVSEASTALEVLETVKKKFDCRFSNKAMSAIESYLEYQNDPQQSHSLVEKLNQLEKEIHHLKNSL